MCSVALLAQEKCIATRWDGATQWDSGARVFAMAHRMSLPSRSMIGGQRVILAQGAHGTTQQLVVQVDVTATLKVLPGFCDEFVCREGEAKI